MIFSTPKYLRNVTSIQIDRKKCTGCTLCTEVCPHNVIAMINKKAEIIDRDACMECGACKKNCPVAAINVNTGVGCAASIYNSFFRKDGKTCCGPDPQNPSCGCSK